MREGGGRGRELRRWEMGGEERKVKSRNETEGLVVKKNKRKGKYFLEACSRLDTPVC